MQPNTSYMSEGARQRAMNLAVELRKTGATHPAIGKALYRQLGYTSYKTGKALTGSAVFSLLKEAQKPGAKRVFKRKNDDMTSNFVRDVRSVLSLVRLSDSAKLAALKAIVGLD